jgi:hypothetical protein
MVKILAENLLTYAKQLAVVSYPDLAELKATTHVIH